MNQPLYQELARLLTAYQNCCSPSANESQREWAPKHQATIEAIVKEQMPSGSGIDRGTKLDLDVSSEEKLVFATAFHHMNEGGMYDGWTEHTVICTPSLAFQFRLKVTGRDRNGIKDYLHSTFQEALAAEVSELEGE